MQKLRRGSQEQAIKANAHLEDADLDRSDTPPLPFTLTPRQQESMLSAHLWKHDIPSVWYGEGAQFELRRERYRRIMFRVGLRVGSEGEGGSYLPADETESQVALDDLLDIVHDRRLDRFRQPQYEEWSDKVGDNNGKLLLGSEELPRAIKEKTFKRNWKWGWSYEAIQGFSAESLRSSMRENGWQHPPTMQAQIPPLVPSG